MARPHQFAATFRGESQKPIDALRLCYVPDRPRSLKAVIRTTESVTDRTVAIGPEAVIAKENCVELGVG